MANDLPSTPCMQLMPAPECPLERLTERQPFSQVAVYPQPFHLSRNIDLSPLTIGIEESKHPIQDDIFGFHKIGSSHEKGHHVR